MNFRKATDELFERIVQQELAEMLGVSVATIRQARLSPEAEAHRSAPHNWESAVMRLAEQRIGRYQKLIERLKDNS